MGAGGGPVTTMARDGGAVAAATQPTVTAPLDKTRAATRPSTNPAERRRHVGDRTLTCLAKSRPIRTSFTPPALSVASVPDSPLSPLFSSLCEYGGCACLFP